MRSQNFNKLGICPRYSHTKLFGEENLSTQATTKMKFCHMLGTKKVKHEFHPCSKKQGEKFCKSHPRQPSRKWKGIRSLLLSLVSVCKCELRWQTSILFSPEWRSTSSWLKRYHGFNCSFFLTSYANVKETLRDCCVTSTTSAERAEA